MHALTTTLFACLFVAGSVTAQNEGETQEKAEQQKAEHQKVLQERRAGQDRKAVDDKGNPADVAGEGIADGTAGAANGNAMGSREALSAASSLQTMVSPPRLAPGETGTITLLLALQPHAVITADAAWRRQEPRDLARLDDPSTPDRKGRAQA